MDEKNARDPFVDPVPIVIDIGSTTIKAGFAGEECPRCRDLPAAIGFFKHKPGCPSDVERYMLDIFERGYAVGDEVYLHRLDLNLNFLCERGVVKNWDAMDKIMRYLFYTDLRVDPAGRSLLITYNPAAQQADIEAIARFLYNMFHVSEVYVVPQAVLALYASGMDSGVVVDLGDTTGWIAPVYEGELIPAANQQFAMGGRDITQYLARNVFTSLPLLERPWPSDAFLIAEDILVKLGYVAKDPSTEAEQYVEKIYTMPDGRELAVGTHRYLGPEVLFSPRIAGKSLDPLDVQVRATIDRCPAEMRPDLYSRIVLAGGTSLIPGLGSRLEKEVQARVSTPVKILEPQPFGQSRQFSAWIGGSMMFSSIKLRRYLVNFIGD
nr:actin family protein [Candidatus Sigynarchaeota archaeon]